MKAEDGERDLEQDRKQDRKRTGGPVGEADWQAPGARVYFRSSEDMTAVADESVDVIVTSPPYNRGKTYSGDDAGRHDDRLPEADYRALLRRVFGECLRVLRSDGVFFLNIGDSATDPGKSELVLAEAKAAGFHFLQEVIWVKSLLGRGHYTPSGGTRRLNNLWESVFVLVKHRKRYRFDTKAIGIPYVDKSNIGRYSESDLRDPGNVWLIPYRKTTGKTIKKGHDAPFPVELARRCIRLVPEAEVVLDPFLGTGSTLAAARSLGLEGIGYERYPRRELIRQTILGPSEDSEPQPLLPHLEASVALLAAALEAELGRDGESTSGPALEGLVKQAGTKAGRTRLEVVQSVLRDLAVAPALQRRLAELLGAP